jgi:hypothetical protein
VLSNGWVQGFGVTSVVTFAALVAAITTHTAVQATVIAFVLTLISTLIAIVVVKSRTGRVTPNRFPERGDHDRRPHQQWESLAHKFGNLIDKPLPIWAQWTYTFETGQYEWSVRHSSDTAIRLCAEICKEAGRLLLAEPSFRKKFPNIVAITDDGDRWLVAIYKVAGIGKVTANSSATTFGVVTTGQGGDIKDLPGASQVLCQMALNGF